MINVDKYDPKDLMKLNNLLETVRDQHSTTVSQNSALQEKSNLDFSQFSNQGSELRSQIYSLVRKFVQDIEVESNDKPELVNRIANKVTSYLIIRSRKISSISKGYKNSETEATKKAATDLKKVMKNFAVYALYKVMNPRRIAGETKADNFVHNATLRGIETAKHYTGGSASEIKNYTPSLIKNINQKRNSIKKGSLTI